MNLTAFGLDMNYVDVLFVGPLASRSPEFKKEGYT